MTPLVILLPHPYASSYAMRELSRMFNIVGIPLRDVPMLEVFSALPVGVPRTDTAAQLAFGPLTSSPQTFATPAHAEAVAALHQQLEALKPNVVLACGDISVWALGLGTGLKALRGSVHSTQFGKVLPTYSPDHLISQWDSRVVMLSDLEKVKLEQSSPELLFDNSELWISPTLADLEDFDARHMRGATVCACDIETKRGQITAVSFAPTVGVSLCIPFWLPDADPPSYWPDAHTELLAWRYAIRWLENPTLTKVFQNGLYDLQYLMSRCAPRACTEDTMLLHHSLFSELPKGLGFLGSIYTNTPSWKNMRTYRKEEAQKIDA